MAIADRACLSRAESFEELWQEFADERFVALGADVWDGTAEQVNTRWRLGKGVTMPFLLNASRMATDYGQTYQTFTIIDHEGLIRFKTTSHGRTPRRGSCWHWPTLRDEEVLEETGGRS